MLKSLELSGFKSFAKKTVLEFNSPITAIVGPNGSGKSNVAEALKFVLGEQSHLSMRTKRGEDLIWNGSKSISQSNRAKVSIVFDNKKRLFKLDSELSPNLDVSFNEIILGREVYRDGGNRYSINDTQVRLRDIVEILASVNIGASGHHIISQGEADRILNASAKDRRIMIEEALGLKIYHWKINESEKKLGKTNENLDKVESLRRELAPHLKFLKKQVEKVEKAEEFRQKLSELYAEYLKKEENYLSREKTRVGSEKKKIEEELHKIDNELKNIRQAHQDSINQSGDSARIGEMRKLDDELNEVREKRDEFSRIIGRIEANIDFISREKKSAEKRMRESAERNVSLSEVQKMADSAEKELSGGDGARTADELKGIISRVRMLIADFLHKHRDNDEEAEKKVNEFAFELSRIEKEKNETEEKLKSFSSRENELNDEIMKIKEEGDKNKEEAHDRDRRFYELTAKKSEQTANLNVIKAHFEIIEKDETAFLEELREGGAILGETVLRYKSYELNETDFKNEQREIQEKRKKEIEKIKIRLEDMGGAGGADLLKEYKETEERDIFLSREIEDLKSSAEKLMTLIEETKEKLDKQFDEGIEKINSQFENFFKLMFGGGNASIKVFTEKKKLKMIDPETGEEISMEEEEEPERGIDIKVNLPQKKIKDLTMLSGGERALTSIALLFAITQVNPPPFLVLDETDAALDEANSRKYGDMLENLSKLSQLVVITHNRETMSRAGVLYGVTTGSDASSKLLSIKFDEAVQIAK